MRMLCFGDSNTYGYDPRGYFGGRYDDANRWVDLLAKDTGWEVCNLGSNGRQIPRNGSALSSFGQLSSEDWIFVMLGTNDLLQGISAKDTTERMYLFLQQLLPHCPNILLVVPPSLKRGAWVPSDELVRESFDLGDEYKRLAEKLGILFADTRDWNVELAFDGVHFTEHGHHIFAKGLADVIAKIHI